MRKNTCLAFILLFFLFGNGFAQELKFTKLPGERYEGVVCKKILEDSHGFLWFATYDGAFKFDGVNTKNFQSDPNDSLSIHHNILTDIMLDGNHLYLTAWGNGNIVDQINTLDHRVNRIILPNNPCTANRTLFKLHNGYYLMAGDKGISYFHPKKNRFIFLPLPVSRVLLQTSGQEILVGAENELLTYVAREDSLFLVSKTKLEGVLISAVEISGNVFIGSTKGLYSSNQDFRIPETLRNLNILTLFLDSRRSLWIGTQAMGLFRWNLSTDEISQFKAAEKPGNLQSNEISCLYEDKNHLLWIGTDFGIYYSQLYNNLISTIPHPPNFINLNEGYAIFQDKQGIIWISSNLGIQFYDPLSGKYLKNILPAINGSKIYPINQEEERYWISSFNTGVYLVERNPKTRELEIKQHLKHTPGMKDGVSSNMIMAVMVDDEKNTWFGHNYHQIDILSPSGKWTHLGEDQINGIAVSQIIQSRDKTIWIGKWDNGLSRCERQPDGSFQFTHYTSKNSSLASMNISSLAEDRQGNLWIGTMSGGLYHFDKSTEKFRRYSNLDGLHSNNVFLVLLDKYDNVWCSTSNGIGVKYSNSERFRVFKESDGVPSNKGNFFAGSLFNNGSVAFGTNTGIAVINPDSLKANTDQYKPIISAIKLHHKEILPQPGGLIRQNPFLVKELEFTYEQDLLTFEFSNKFFHNPGSVQYGYFLKGFDQEWNDIGKSNLATFTRLPAGQYRLNVRSSTDGGFSYSYIEDPIKITILPAWWQTWWFRGLCGAAALALLWWFFHQNTLRQLAAQRAELEKQQALERERERIARDMHDDLGSGLSAIHLLSNFAKDKAQDTEIRNEVEKIASSSAQLNQNIREIIWTVNSADDSLASLAHFLRRYCAEFQENTGKVVSFEMPPILPDRNLSGEVRRNLFLCVKEALNNAAKYSQAEKIEVHLRVTKEKIAITVRDNGIGFDQNSALQNGGNGFRNMQRRMKDIGGSTAFDGKKGAAEVRFELG